MRCSHPNRTQALAERTGALDTTGWTTTTDDDGTEHHVRRHRLVSVLAVWNASTNSGTIRVRSTYLGSTRVHAVTADPIRERAAFWTAATLAADVVAAPLPVVETALGDPEVVPEGSPLEADITFATTSGRPIVLTITDEQGNSLGSGLHGMEKHVWSEDRDARA